MSLSMTFTTGKNFILTNNKTNPVNIETVYPIDFTPTVFLDSSNNTLIDLEFSSFTIEPTSNGPEAYIDIYNSNQEKFLYNTFFTTNKHPSLSSLSKFDTNYTFDHINLSTYTITTLFGQNGTCTWTNFTMQYFYVPYILHISKNQNGFENRGDYTVRTSNQSNTAFELRTSSNNGYRLKGYYINNTYIENTSSSNDSPVFIIDPSSILINNICNIELIYEPKTFIATCKSIDKDRNITTIDTLNVTYGQDAYLPIKPNNTEEFIYYGWINGTASDISRPGNNQVRIWVSNNQINFINDNVTPISWYINSTQYSSGANLKNFQNGGFTHNSTLYFYYWIVPRCHKISYEWLDDLTNERTCYQPPEAQYPRCNMDTLEVATIPLFNKYTVENAHTKNWYYYDSNNELQTNNLTTIPVTNDHDIIFYGRKSLASESGSYITWSVNNPDWGEIDYYQTKPDDDYYDAASTVTAQAIPNNKRKFLKWNDNDTNPFKSELAGTTDRNYIATLASQAYIGENPVNDVYVGTTPVRAIYQGTTCVYEKGD